VRVSQNHLEDFLGIPRYGQNKELGSSQIGVAYGLAVTDSGGEVLQVEVATMPGRGQMIVTGRLGEVMQESAKAALSYAKSRSKELGIDIAALEKLDLHIHLPEGAVPKDGPSAGITMATALISALSKRRVRNDTAMTGEITLRGRVLAIGGLKDKALAAHRAGIKRIITSVENKKDIPDLPKNVLKELEWIWVENMDEVVREILVAEDVPPAMAQPEQAEVPLAAASPAEPATPAPEPAEEVPTAPNLPGEIMPTDEAPTAKNGG
jgi:ATP-dependent Lon protease